MTHATGYLKHGSSKSFELPTFNAIWKKEETRTVLEENKLNHECSIFLCQTGVQGTDGNLVGKSLTFCSTSFSFASISMDVLEGADVRCIVECQAFHITRPDFTLRSWRKGSFMRLFWPCCVDDKRFHECRDVSPSHGSLILQFGPYRWKPMVWTLSYFWCLGLTVGNLWCGPYFVPWFLSLIVGNLWFGPYRVLAFGPYRRDPMVCALLCALDSCGTCWDLIGFVGTWFEPLCNLVLS